MKAISSEIRTIQTPKGNIKYTFERKNVKNINLRIRHDGSVYVSAPPSVSVKTVEDFVFSRSSYIKNAVERFEQHKFPKTDMQYISGENITLLGKNMRINVIQDSDEYISCDGIYVYIHVRQTDCYNRKKNMLNLWLDKQCISVFDEQMHKIYKKFKPYNIDFPQLKIRSMTSRWGSCQPSGKVITLNRKLIEAPENCIEYVITHEFCHFIHPNHSKQFYTLLQVMLPDWKESKSLLENNFSDF